MPLTRFTFIQFTAVLAFVTLVSIYFSSSPLNETRSKSTPLRRRENQNSTIKACLLVLVRNSELQGLMSSMRDLEDRFNHRHNYPYVILNDKPFTQEFKEKIQNITKSKIEFGLVPQEHWSYPSFIDQDKAAQLRLKNKDTYDYGGSESYRFMCRFFSGFFFRHELTLKYDYYWRVEPNVKFTCDILEDPFRRLEESGAMYGFSMSLMELPGTIPTLWSTFQEWIQTSIHTKKFPKNNAMRFVSSTFGFTYNLCHFWSNFEIGNFNLWRSEAYLDYFNFLDLSGGFFYERWGDAPVHSLYASIALSPSQIIYFEEIGYVHDNLSHCPQDLETLQNCQCDPKNDYNTFWSCINRWKSLYP